MNRPRLANLPRRRGAAALVTLLWVVALALASPGSAASPAVSPAPRPAAAVVASGPFGTVAGLPLAPGDAVPDPATLEALDAWGQGRTCLHDRRRSVVRCLAGDHDAGADGCRRDVARARQLAWVDQSSIPRRPVSSSSASMPRSPIRPRQEARHTEGSWLWRVAVPDRDVPEGGDPYPPAPALLLASGDDEVALEAGSGCFVGTCGDIGATSPPRTLPTIRTRAGAPLLLRLGDGSGMDAWTASVTAIGGSDDQAMPLGASAGVAPVTRGTFAAPSEGRWMVVVHVRFDRDRGSFDGYGRLILGAADR